MRLANGSHRFLRVGNGLFASHFRFCTVANCDSARLRVAIVCYIWPIVTYIEVHELSETFNGRPRKIQTNHFDQNTRTNKEGHP
ncbi:hypothetical protein NDU88_003449 [Pleurodeles waltl]|uniref:Secreted protein n=1 Tax=Pleurodeles waltl TaxID=8319 RepID=A0AAV7M5C1_PLEWA|nr:hypothetical protein NDU88_003449 [Pleurodeles waltl]